MAIPAQSRWWIATVLILVTLLLISALALDRPNVVWDANGAQCPFCRGAVQDYSSRCGRCRGDFDWTVAPEAQSPISKHSLSLLEEEWLRGRVASMGPDNAAPRVAVDTGMSVAAAREYLSTVGKGDCGWCGGTHKDLTSDDLRDAELCPLCLGTGASIACGGDRRIEVGNWGAERAYQGYVAEMRDLLGSALPEAEMQREARRLAEGFLRPFAGTAQASRIYFWQLMAPGVPPSNVQMATFASRDRLDRVMRALRAAE